MTTRSGPAKPAADAAPDRDSMRMIWENLLGLPLWIAFAAGFAALIKVMTVSNYSLNTTLVIITTSSRDVLLGAVTSNAYLLIGMAAFGVLYTGIKLGAFHRGTPLATTLTVLAFVLCSLEIPWRYWFTGLALFLLAGGLSLSRRLLTTVAVRIVMHLLAVMIGLVLVWFVLPTVRQPWLPAEYLVLDRPIVVAQESLGHDGPHLESAFVGYVISSAPDGWTTVLTAQYRFIARIPSVQIRSRYICTVPDSSLSGEQSIYQWINQQPYDGPNKKCDHIAERVQTATIPPRQR